MRTEQMMRSGEETETEQMMRAEQMMRRGEETEQMSQIF
jgi:hypothetical protein